MNPKQAMQNPKFVFATCLLIIAAGVGLTGLAVQEKAPSSGLSGAGPVVHGTADDPLRDPREAHLHHVQQLTFGGQNAEAYFSPDGRRLIFQSTRPPYACDQMFAMNADGSDVRLVSTGKGKTTCGYFYPDGQHILYSSTHLGSAECPPRPDYSKGYVWGVYPSFQIFYATERGEILKQLTEGPGYNAEATLSYDGKKIVFTSIRDGDLDIYTMDPDGGGVKRLTRELGYDGGPFFSPDGQWIVYRACHPTRPEEIVRYKSLLEQGLVEPLRMDLFVMRADGSERRVVTQLGGASFAPSFFPDSRRIIFASNYENPDTSQFELYAIERDGGHLERITQVGGFQAFPMFSPNGKKLVFASNRNSKQPHEINIFIADWVP
jgi:Tol biopolymer transport system component